MGTWAPDYVSTLLPSLFKEVDNSKSKSCQNDIIVLLRGTFLRVQGHVYHWVFLKFQPCYYDLHSKQLLTE